MRILSIGLVRAIDDSCNNAAGNTLVLTPTLAGRIACYVQNYGQGGFQGRLKPVLHELAEPAKILEPLVA